MLVLTRKSQEEILIGDSIRISVVRIQGGSVRLGIEAPRDVRVVRAELPPHDDAGESPIAESADESRSPAPHAEAANDAENATGEATPLRLTPALKNARVRNVLDRMLSGSRPSADQPRENSRLRRTAGQPVA